MREEPLITRAWIKAAFVVLIAGALGVGAYLLASGADIELPDLPEIEEIDSGEGTTNLSDTTLEDTTIGESTSLPSDPFTSAGFGAALAKVREEVGPGQRVTRVSINDTQTQFSVLRGEDGIEVYSVRADDGELDRQEATVTIAGDATLEDFAFGLDGIDPAAVDRMLTKARALSGSEGFQATVLGLERRLPFGSRELAWTISAETGDRALTFRASADGRRVEDIGGGEAPIPPQVQAAKELNECIEAAGTDIDRVTACFDRFR
jgi:hypothetical protein